MNSRLRDGTLIETYDGEGKIIDYLYGSGFGRDVLRVLVSPWVSKSAGVFLDSRFSSLLVRGFVRKNHLDMSEYPDRKYRSFNDFFTRKIKEGKRVFDPAENRLTSPCDGKVTVFELAGDSHFRIKGCDYTLQSLLKDKKLADYYNGGYGILIRLTVDDYHRYAYPVSGLKSDNIHIDGVFHTVNPRAAESLPIYQENSREYTLISTDRFGTVLMMEVGALLVGRIKNLDGPCSVIKGAEKGFFEFGGSSVLLLLGKDHFCPDNDLIDNSLNGEETVVRMGEGIGNLM